MRPQVERCAARFALPVDRAGVDAAFVEAAVFANSGVYERSIDALIALGRPNDPSVLNHPGFSHRKLGRIDEAPAQLAEIAAWCGTGCEAYARLWATIDAHTVTANRPARLSSA